MAGPVSCLVNGNLPWTLGGRLGRQGTKSGRDRGAVFAAGTLRRPKVLDRRLRDQWPAAAPWASKCSRP